MTTTRPDAAPAAPEHTVVDQELVPLMSKSLVNLTATADNRTPNARASSGRRRARRSITVTGASSRLRSLRRSTGGAGAAGGGGDWPPNGPHLNQSSTHPAAPAGASAPRRRTRPPAPAPAPILLVQPSTGGSLTTYPHDPPFDDHMADNFERLKAALTASYALERELGSGGMATVYLAEDCGTTGKSRSRCSGPRSPPPSAASGSSARSRSPPGCSIPTSCRCSTRVEGGPALRTASTTMSCLTCRANRSGTGWTSMASCRSRKPSGYCARWWMRWRGAQQRRRPPRHQAR